MTKLDTKSFTRDDGRTFNLTRKRPDYASFETYMEKGGGYAEGGLWIEAEVLIDFDGIYALPIEVAEWLRSLGVTVPEECL